MMPSPLSDVGERLHKPLLLQPDQVHWWFCFPDEIDDPALLTSYHKLLNVEEESRRQRFHFEKHRKQHLITRALIRTTLSRYSNIDPREWCFTQNKYGKPSAVPVPDAPLLGFNISHTEGLITCAITLDKDVGVDVEDCKRVNATRDIAQRFFSAVEANDLASFPDDLQKDRFFHYWTLKEAYIKARGKGISIPLEQFSYHFSNHGKIVISIDPRLHDKPGKWHFLLLSPTSTHRAALATERHESQFKQVFIRKTVPLKHDCVLNFNALASSGAITQGRGEFDNDLLEING